MSQLRCWGVAREPDNNRALSFYFDRPPTDDELRFLHDAMRVAAGVVDKDRKQLELRLITKDG